MAFISLLFVGLYFIFLVVGTIEILISLIILIVRAYKIKNQKTVKKVSKHIAIVLLIFGIITYIPFVIKFSVNEYSDYKYRVKIKNLKNKTVISNSTLADVQDKGFTYKGDKYIMFSMFDSVDYSDMEEMKKEFKTNFVNKDMNDYKVLYYLVNDSGYDIYILEHCFFAKKEDISKIKDYYLNSAKYKVYLSTDEDDYKKINADSKKIHEIYMNETKEETKIKDNDDFYGVDINIVSFDKVVSNVYEFYITDDAVYSDYYFEDNNVVGNKLSEESEKYIRELI